MNSNDTAVNNLNQPRSIQANGSITEYIHTFNWSETSIGTIEEWPQTFRAVVNMMLKASEAMVLFWGSNSLTIYNDAYAFFAGDKHAVLLGSKGADSWPEMAEFNQSGIQNGLANEATFYKGQPLTIYRDGLVEQVWVNANFMPVIDENGNPAGVLAIITEVLSQDIATKVLIKAEERNQFISNTTPVMLWITDENHRCTYLNQTWLDYTGQTLEEGLGLGWLEVTHPDDKERAARIFAEAASKQEAFSLDYRLKRKDGEYRWMLDSGVALIDQLGKFQGYTGYVIDITERKQAEDLLSIYSKQQDALAVFSLQAMTGVDDINKIMRIAVEMVAITLNTGYSKIVQHIPNTEDTLHFLAVFGFSQSLVGQVFDPGKEPHAAYTLKALKPIVVHDIHKETRFQWSPLHQEYGLISGIAVVIYAGGKPFGVLETDSTKKRLFGEVEINFLQTAATLIGTVIERKQSEIALAAKNALINDYAKRLEVSNLDLNQFASIISHDLQAPLRKVMMFSDFITQKETGQLSKEGQDYIARIRNSVIHMQTMITDLLSLARVERANITIKVIDFHQIMNQVLEDLAFNIRETGTEIKKTELVCHFEADETQMIQMFSNLIGNAIKYRRENAPPEIHVSCETKDDDWVQITITDNGIGIKPEHYQKIFEIFQRLSNGSSASGTGIGLAIVKRIVERHHGTIDISSMLGQGTTFIVKLPLKQTG